MFDTTDLDVANTILSEQYASMRVSAPGPRHGLRIVQHDLGRVSMDRITVRMDMDTTAEPLDALAVGRVREGHICYRQGGDDRFSRRGDVFLAVHPGTSWSASLSDLDVDFAFISPDLLSEVAQTPPGTPGPVRLLDREPISPAAGAQWARTYAAVQRMLTDGSPVMTNPLVLRQAERLIAAATLAAFPNSAQTDPTIEDRHDAHPNTVRRAIAFIEHSPDLALTSADIAAAAYVTIRALQLAFRRHVGTTPMAYLRRVRLGRVHHELLAADPRDDTVTAIAARWGFASHSRFAAAYRAAYGQPPSHTLRDGAEPPATS